MARFPTHKNVPCDNCDITKIRFASRCLDVFGAPNFCLSDIYFRTCGIQKIPSRTNYLLIAIFECDRNSNRTIMARLDR